MVSVESVAFDFTGCDLKESGEHHRAWVNREGVVHRLELHAAAPAWDFDVTDVAGAEDHFGRQALWNGGVMLALEAAPVAGVEALRGLFKFRVPSAESLGMRYVGSVWLPFRDVLFQIDVEAAEGEITGKREAIVRLQVPDGWPPPEEPVRTAEDFQRRRKERVYRLPSDGDIRP